MTGHTILPPLSAVVLAGGRGKRLGTDKASVVLDGATLLDRVLAVVETLSNDVIVVLRGDQEPPPCSHRTITDDPQHTGALAGIAAGLEAARNEWALLVACDMPFLNPGLFRYMATLRDACDAVVPHPPLGHEPLHALYHRRCLPALSASLDRGERRLRAFYADLKVRFVPPEDIRRHDPEGLSFFNINTAEDMVVAREHILARAICAPEEAR